MAAVKDNDLGFRRIITNLQSFDGVQISVGVLRDAGKADDGKTDLTEIAAYNEYGTKTIPARPFVKIASDENGDSWQDLAEQGVNAVISGNLGMKQVMNLVAKRMQADVQKVFGSSKLKANAPSTVKAKGSSAPLIDTGRLRQSINYRIDE